MQKKAWNKTETQETEIALRRAFVSGHDFSRAINEQNNKGFSRCHGKTRKECLFRSNAHRGIRLRTRAAGAKARFFLVVYGTTKVVP
jgi:hypothetical protein